MKFKRLIQALVLFTLTFSLVGGSQSALASSNSAMQADAMIVNRNLNSWDTPYVGYVSSSIYESWHFDLSETHNFVITVSPITGTSDFVPLLTLFDANGMQLAQGTNSLTSIQRVGGYSVQEIGRASYRERV